MEKTAELSRAQRLLCWLAMLGIAGLVSWVMIAFLRNPWLVLLLCAP